MHPVMFSLRSGHHQCFSDPLRVKHLFAMSWILLMCLRVAACGDKLDATAIHIVNGVAEWRGVLMSMSGFSTESRILDALRESQDLREFLGIEEAPSEDSAVSQEIANSLDAEHKERMTSMFFYAEGLCALRRADCAAVIELDEHTRAEIERIWQGYRAHMAVGFGEAQDCAWLGQCRMLDFLADKQVLKLLTPEHVLRLTRTLERWKQFEPSNQILVSFSSSAPKVGGIAVLFGEKRLEVMESTLSMLCHLNLRRCLLMQQGGMTPISNISSREFIEGLQQSIAVRRFVFPEDGIGRNQMKFMSLLSRASYATVHHSDLWSALSPQERARARLGLLSIEGIRSLLHRETQELIGMTLEEKQSVAMLFEDYRNKLWQQELESTKDRGDGERNPIGLNWTDVPYDPTAADLFERFSLEMDLLEKLPPSVFGKFKEATKMVAPHWTAFSEIGVLQHEARDSNNK